MGQERERVGEMAGGSTKKESGFRSMYVLWEGRGERREEGEEKERLGGEGGVWGEGRERTGEGEGAERRLEWRER